MGFRGEALPSIAAVSKIRLKTVARNEQVGTQLCLTGGTLDRVEDAAAIPGTSIEVSELFYNTPARKKFLKSTTTEFSHISHAVQQAGLAWPQVHVRLIHNGYEVFNFPGVSSHRDRVLQIYRAYSATGRWSPRPSEMVCPSRVLSLTRCGHEPAGPRRNYSSIAGRLRMARCNMRSLMGIVRSLPRVMSRSLCCFLMSSLTGSTSTCTRPNERCGLPIRSRCTSSFARQCVMRSVALRWKPQSLVPSMRG